MTDTIIQEKVNDVKSIEYKIDTKSKKNITVTIPGVRGSDGGLINSKTFVTEISLSDGVIKVRYTIKPKHNELPEPGYFKNGKRKLTIAEKRENRRLYDSKRSAKN